ncbi:hypothetical protein SK128_022460 [Halocaridina rubra]|uniref:Uncharacterized protein n=1 Tax=Halocaridina rubra TaxID=373956 RepID=A0AAN8WPL7_HALRR
MKASLAFIRNATNITDLAADGKNYFTTHAMTSMGVPALPTGLEISCDATTGAECQETENEQCSVISKTETKFISCLDAATHYACMLPAYCPDPYTEYEGACYSAMQYSGDAISGLTNCGTSGGQLAYPQNVATMDFLAGLVRTLLAGSATSDITPTDVLLGLNNM